MERDVAPFKALPANVAVGSKVNAIAPAEGVTNEFKVSVDMEVVPRAAELKSRGLLRVSAPLFVPKVSAVKLAGVDRPTILPRMVCVKVCGPL